MKEDKENTRPKDKRVEIKGEDGEKMEKCKEKKEAMTKVKSLTVLALALENSLCNDFYIQYNIFNNNEFVGF